MTASPPLRASWGQMVCWALYDWANSSFSAVIQTFVFAAYFARFVAPDETIGAARWGYALGVAGLVIAVTGPILGAIADQSGRRKPWIAAFTALAVVSTGLLWFVRPRSEDMMLALVLVGVGTVGSELAVLFYNAMLPGLAEPSRIGRWSGWAWGAGYLGGLACLVVALVVFIRPEAAGESWLDGDQAEGTRAVFVLVAVWYALFALPLLLWTPDEPPSPRPAARRVREGWRQLRHSLRQVRRYGPILRFLIAHMLYVDALVTLFAFGGIYAASVFGMDAQQVLMLGIGLNLTAGLGAAAFGWVDDRLGSRRTILLSLAALTVCTAAILLARTTPMFWMIALVLGVFVGPVQAASRSYLSRVAPSELRNEMFGLYALAGKATAFAGPLLVGTLTQVSGSHRIGMSVIVLLLLAGGAVMFTVPAAEQRLE